jgi:hypothetical protein
MVLGLGITLDCFLFMFTYLPLRVLYATGAVLAYPLCSHRLRKQQRMDLARAVVIGGSLFFLSAIDISLIYHFIRGQSVLKLYVIFNMLQVCVCVCVCACVCVYACVCVRV